MNHEQAWDDMKKWLESGIEYMAVRKDELEGEGHKPASYQEFHRVKGKLDGLKTALAHMEQTERMNADS